MFETIRRQFLAEVTAGRDPARRQVTSLDEVDQLLDSWVRKACHQRVHSETGQGRPRTLTNSNSQAGSRHRSGRPEKIIPQVAT